MNSRPRPLVLCILDGWGERPNGEDNAIDRTPATCAGTTFIRTLETSGAIPPGT